MVFSLQILSKANQGKGEHLGGLPVKAGGILFQTLFDEREGGNNANHQTHATTHQARHRLVDRRRIRKFIATGPIQHCLKDDVR